MPNSPGVTAGTSKDTLVLKYNDVEALAGGIRASTASSIAARDHRAGRRQHGLRRADARLPVRGAADHAGARQPAHLRRSHDRLPRGLGGAQAPVRDHARPHDLGQDRRRRTADRGLRRTRRHHGPRAARRARVSGRHAQRQSAGDGRRHRDAATAAGRSALRTTGSTGSPPGARLAPRRCRRRHPAPASPASAA